MSKIQRWYIKPNGVLIHCDDYNKVEENLEEQICKSSDVAALEARALAAEAENMCDACMGTGEPTSGKPCMCGGTGKMSDAAIYLREQLNKDDVEIERLIISRAAIADELVILRKELDEAQRHWDKSNRQVEPLKAENLQLKLEIAAGRTKDDKLEKENEHLKCCGNCEHYHCDSYSNRCIIAIGGNNTRARKPCHVCDDWQPTESRGE